MLSQAATAAFRTSLRGPSFVPGEPGYDAARVVFNRIVDRRPAIIARCAGAADVIACVGFARERDLPVSVRGGGHSIAGKAICDDGLMIDLSAMKGFASILSRKQCEPNPASPSANSTARRRPSGWRQRWV